MVFPLKVDRKNVTISSDNCVRAAAAQHPTSVTHPSVGEQAVLNQEVA